MRPRVVALAALLSLLAAASAADALTITGGNVRVPANTVGDPNVVVTATGTTTFNGRVDADALVVSSVGAITATAGELSAVQATFLTTGANINLAYALNSIDRATLDTSNNTGAVADIVLNEQQGVILDRLRGRVVRIGSKGGTITVTTSIRATGALTLQTTSGGVAVAGDTSIGASSAISATSAISLAGKLTVPAVRTGYALQITGPGADVAVTLDVGALGFVPTTETRLHVFSWQTPGRTASVDEGSFPALPPGMTWDRSELATTGDLVIRVCGDGARAITEQCDDGNTTAGDGCDATCHVEPPSPPDAGPDATAPDAGPSAEDAGPDATAPDGSVAGDAAVDAGYGGNGGGLIDDDHGNAAEIDIEGGACAFGGGLSGATSSGGLAASVGLGLAALARRRARRRSTI